MTAAAAFALAIPLYLLILIGYLLARAGGWPATIADALSRFVFVIAIPALLLQLTSEFWRLPAVDPRLLFAYFGGCLTVFVLARVIGARVFGQDGVAQSVFGMAAIYGNNVLLGLPIAKSALGEAAVPSIALVLALNSLVLWTLATASVEWERHGKLTLNGIAQTVTSVVTNPIIASILVGTAWGLTGWPLPGPLRATLALLGQAAVPLALVTVGFGLAGYRIADGLREALAITGLKLVVLPLIVWGLARLIGLPPLETAVVTLMASIALGVNGYLMAREFRALQGAVGAALLISTAISAVALPLTIVLLGAG
ncbi:MAG: AEC family transporter [Lautropia sp.]